MWKVKAEVHLLAARMRASWIILNHQRSLMHANIPLLCTPGARSLAGNCNGDPVLCCSVAHYLFPNPATASRVSSDHPSILRRQRETRPAGMFADGRAHPAHGHGSARCGPSKWKRRWISGTAADVHLTQWTRLGASAIWNQTNYCLLSYASYYCIFVFFSVFKGDFT